MARCKTDLEMALYSALKRITQYQTPAHMRRLAGCHGGLSPEEAIEMAYENVLAEARHAIRNIRPRAALASAQVQREAQP